MKRFTSTKPLTGIEIGPSQVKSVQVIKERGGRWQLTACRAAALPPHALRLAYGAPNIRDAEAFGQAVREATGFLKPGGARVGVSLPSEVIKTSLQEYADLPDSPAEIERMVLWRTEKLFQVPQSEIRLSYHPFFREPGKPATLLVSFAHQEIIRDYTRHLADLGLEARVIRPAGVNHLNFYGSQIPPQGTAAVLGVFESYLAIWIFDNDCLLFYHGLKKGIGDPHFFSDIEMTFAMFHETFAGHPLDKVLFGSQIGYEAELKEGLARVTNLDATPFDEARLIQPAAGPEPESPPPLASLAAAIGAAQGLAD